MYEVKASSPGSPGTSKNCGSTGGAVVLGVFGLIFFSIGMIFSWPCFRAAEWPTVPGTVLDSSIHTSRSSKGGSTHRCRVHYTFLVGGSQYTGEKLDMVPISTSGSGPYEDLKRYPPGAACEVHYNPASPFENCLRPGPGILQYVFLWLGFGFFAIATFVGVSAWWKKGVPRLQ